MSRGTYGVVRFNWVEGSSSRRVLRSESRPTESPFGRRALLVGLFLLNVILAGIGAHLLLGSPKPVSEQPVPIGDADTDDRDVEVGARQPSWRYQSDADARIRPNFLPQSQQDTETEEDSVPALREFFDDYDHARRINIFTLGDEDSGDQVEFGDECAPGIREIRINGETYYVVLPNPANFISDDSTPNYINFLSAIQRLSHRPFIDGGEVIGYMEHAATAEGEDNVLFTKLDGTQTEAEADYRAAGRDTYFNQEGYVGETYALDNQDDRTGRLPEIAMEALSLPLSDSSLCSIGFNPMTVPHLPPISHIIGYLTVENEVGVFGAVPDGYNPNRLMDMLMEP